MELTAREKAKLDDFEAIYRQARLPVIQAIERRVCGCDYGATSWTTRDEADFIAAVLGLSPDVRLLDVGSGAGWPGIYLASRTGCPVTLTDLPLSGLEIAMQRAEQEGIAERCHAVRSDAARLPFQAASFDVINQSDLLCCLVEKGSVLRECRRVIRPGGLMACSLIYVTPGLDPVDHVRAVETAPDFVEVEVEYPVLFARTGWEMQERRDLTEEFTRSCSEMLRAEADLRPDLERVVGADALDAHDARMRRRIDVLGRGHLKRELFVLAGKP